MKKSIFIETIGWIGTIAIVVAYGLSSFGIIASSNLLYQLLNLFGSIGIVAVSLYKKVYQTAVLNIIWLIIAVVAIVRLFL